MTNLTNLTSLKAIQAAAFAAWKASPDKSRAEKARLAAELDAAAKAVTAAKKLAEPAVAVVDTASAVAAWNAKQAATAAENDLRKRVFAAYRFYQRESDWPRCGQDWPAGGREVAADKLLRENAAMIDGGWE